MSDSSLPQLAKTLNQIGDAFEIFRRKNDERLDALMDRIEEAESKHGGPPGSGTNRIQSRVAGEHKAAFADWLRKPGDPERQSALTEVESKAVTIGTPAAGGYGVPEEISREIERLEKLYSPVRNLVRVVRAGTSDWKTLVNLRGATAGWAAESTDRSTPTSTPQLRERVPTWGEIYSYPEASEWSLDDVFFDVEDWLAEECAQEFAISEGTAVISGDGTNKPTGMLNSDPTAVADFASPPRDASTYQFIPSLSTSSPAVAEIVPDALIDLVYSVNSAYRARGTFTMNSATAAALRKLKDNDGRYLWVDGLQNGQPNRLIGYPVAIWEQMEDIAANAHPIAFGDWRRGYVLVEHAAGMRITVDAVTRPGYKRFYIRRREAGICLNNHAVKWMKTTIA